VVSPSTFKSAWIIVSTVSSSIRVFHPRLCSSMKRLLVLLLCIVGSAAGFLGMTTCNRGNSFFIIHCHTTNVSLISRAAKSGSGFPLDLLDLHKLIPFELQPIF
jgi:hypothetical protein